MVGSLEFLVRNFGDDACFCPDHDSWHGSQDKVTRVGLHECFNLCEDLFTGGGRLLEHCGELGQENACSAGSRYSHGLLIQGCEYVGGTTFPGPWSMLRK